MAGEGKSHTDRFVEVHALVNACFICSSSPFLALKLILDVNWKGKEMELRMRSAT